MFIICSFNILYCFFRPQNLVLTASNETILVDNIDVFKKNGFDFIVEADGKLFYSVQYLMVCCLFSCIIIVNTLSHLKCVTK